MIQCHSDQELSKLQRASTSDHWFKNYGNFTEGVDFAYWWSFSGGGSAINGLPPSFHSTSTLIHVIKRLVISPSSCHLFHKSFTKFILFRTSGRSIHRPATSDSAAAAAPFSLSGIQKLYGKNFCQPIKKQACCAGCRRRPFPMKLHQWAKSTRSVKWP